MMYVKCIASKHHKIHLKIDFYWYVNDSFMEFSHCVESVQMRSFSGPYFPVFRPEKTLYLDISTQSLPLFVRVTYGFRQ